MGLISDTNTTLSLLQDQARQSPQRLYATFENQSLNIGELSVEAGKVAMALSNLGVKSGDRVAVMLDNSLDYVVLFFALIWLGAIHVPVNTRLRHSSLKFLIGHAKPPFIIIEQDYIEHLDVSSCSGLGTTIISRDPASKSSWKLTTGKPLNLDLGTISPVEAQSSDVLFIMYTSGTTGPPKGVLVTDKMLRASAYAAALTSDAQAGDRFPIWEPLYHIGAAQLLPMALEAGVELHFIGAFSASQFWKKVKAVRATQIHFLGGILQILLRQPPNSLDQQHGCRIAWGGGAPTAVSKEFEARFNIQVRESYGMTEASSLTSINTDGHKGSVGKVAPYFDVRIMGPGDEILAHGVHGEIAVRGREQGLITPGYYDNETATQKTIRDQWLYTGDLGYLDQHNYLYYAGRVKESIRRRGENISAWEIERVVEMLEIVEQAAAIGVTDELGDEEIKLFVKLSQHDTDMAPALQILNWCTEQLANFQIPRYLAIVEQFTLTGTQRIRKELLPKSIDDCIEFPVQYGHQPKS